MGLLLRHNISGDISESVESFRVLTNSLDSRKGDRMCKKTPQPSTRTHLLFFFLASSQLIDDHQHNSEKFPGGSA